MYVIGISGGSGSGKTSFIKGLKEAFDETELATLTLDNYYKDQSEQKLDCYGVHNFDLPTALDMEGCVADILALKKDEKVRRKTYTFNNDKKMAQDILISPAPVLIVEGLFIYHEEKIRDMLDFSIMIHASDIHKIVRRIKRDKHERNYPLDDVLHRYQYHVKPSYERFIRPYMEEVDIVINNKSNFDKALEMLVNHIGVIINKSR